MLSTKHTEAQLQVIIEENGLNSAIAVLCNAIDRQIRAREIAHAEGLSDAFNWIEEGDFEDTEEYKNLSLALGVLEAVMQAFDIDESKAGEEARRRLMDALIENVTQLTVTR